MWLNQNYQRNTWRYLKYLSICFSHNSFLTCFIIVASVADLVILKLWLSLKASLIIHKRMYTNHVLPSSPQTVNRLASIEHNTNNKQCTLIESVGGLWRCGVWHKGCNIIITILGLGQTSYLSRYYFFPLEPITILGCLTAHLILDNSFWPCGSISIVDGYSLIYLSAKSLFAHMITFHMIYTSLLICYVFQ